MTHVKMMIDQCFQADSRLSSSQRWLLPASLSRLDLALAPPGTAYQEEFSYMIFQHVTVSAGPS
jgi:hypothetical protein